MNEFNKKINKAIRLIEEAAAIIEDSAEVEEYLNECYINTEYPKIAVIDFIKNEC
jgi:hypothetical protein